MAQLFTVLGTFLWALARSSIFWTLVVVVFKDSVSWLVGAVFGMAVNGINSVGMTIPTLSSVVGMLPVEMLQIMKRVGLDDCLQIIVTAYTIRAGMHLFSFVKSLKPRA